MTLAETKVGSLFARADPEIVLEDFSKESRGLVFQLLDCDGYRLGQLVFEDVGSVCVTTSGIAYTGFNVLREDEICQQVSWLKRADVVGRILILLTPAVDCEEEDMTLPVVGGVRCGFVLCGKFLFKTEGNPGR